MRRDNTRENLRTITVDTPNGKMTKAFIDKADMDAMLRVLTKVFGNKENIPTDRNVVKALKRALNLEACIMNLTYSGSVLCRPEDTYNEKIGESLAVKKAMRNHHESFTKKLKAWQIIMLTKVYEVSPETFESAVKDVITKQNKIISDNKKN